MPPLDDGTVSRVGAALVAALVDAEMGPPISVVVGCDTRESSRGDRAGLSRAASRRSGRPSRFAGVVPTPAVA